MATIRILSEAQVRGLADVSTALQAVEDAYCQFGRHPEVQSTPPIMTIAGPRPTLGRAALGQYRIKGASIPSCGAAGAFLYTRDYPYMYLWSTDTDEPIGLVACDWLSQFRVAITVVYAIRVLARSAIRKIAFFGAGKYAAEPCRLLAQQWPDTTIAVVASRQASAAAFAASMPDHVTAASDPQTAIQNADVVVTLTNASGPFVRAGWLSPGALLLSMGSAHEVQIEVLHEIDGLIVDDLPYARAQGDLGAWLRRGELSEEELAKRIRANIGEVAAGMKAGRKSRDEKLLVILQGLTACDVVLAKTVLDRAVSKGVGQTVTI